MTPNADLLTRILAEWRNSEVERRRLLLLECQNIEKRWGLGPYRGAGEIVRLLEPDSREDPG